MPAFKAFGADDQVDNVLILQPKYDLVSGSLGWRGGPEGSASISLYGGSRRTGAGIFTDLRYQTRYPAVDQIGQSSRKQPMTASVNIAWMTNETIPIGQRGNTRWGSEHWGTVMRLYQDYQSIDPDYVTSSYDYYSVYFNYTSLNTLVVDTRTAVSTALLPSASFTIESWVKPCMTSSTTNDFTLQSMNSSFWFGITGSNGMLKFSSSLGQSATSSVGLNNQRWNHVAFSYNSVSRTGTFYVNLQAAGTFTSPSSSITANQSAVTFLSIGNQISDDSVGFSSVVGRARRAFCGFFGETRYWEGARSANDLSGSAYSRLTGSSVSNPLSYLMMNEGPLALVDTITMGSGTIDVAGRARSRAYTDGRLTGFNDRVGPVWQPNDNVSFFPTKALAPVLMTGSWGRNRSADVSRMLVVDVPSAFYGRQIVPGSVQMVCGAYSAQPFGLIRTLVDDGRGGLYVSGSLCSSSLSSKESYAGVGWNKVGNVFYGEGLIVIKDPSLLDFGRTDGSPNAATDTMQLSFLGDSRIPVKTLMCRVDRGEFNASTNQTFFTTGSAGERIRRHSSGSVYATTVGIYNSDRELVGVARLADPIRIRPRDRINIKLRMDF